MTTDPKRIFQTTRIVHWALVMPMILFAAFVYIKNVSATNLPNDLTINQLTYIPLFLMVIAILLGRFLYQMQINRAKEKPFSTRMQAYQTAVLLRGALFEAAGMSACVIGFITFNDTILLLIPVILLQFYVNRPSTSRIENDLQATRDELNQLA